jgi:hypothetical protein
MVWLKDRPSPEKPGSRDYEGDKVSAGHRICWRSSVGKGTFSKRAGTGFETHLATHIFFSLGLEGWSTPLCDVGFHSLMSQQVPTGFVQSLC